MMVAMPAPGSHDIEVVRGDDFVFAFTIYDVSSTGVKTARNLTGASAAGQVRTTANQTGSVVLTMTAASTATDYTNGIVRFTIPAASTDAVNEGTYYYDMQVTAGGKKRTWLKGKFVISSQVTTT